MEEIEIEDNKDEEKEWNNEDKLLEEVASPIISESSNSNISSDSKFLKFSKLSKFSKFAKIVWTQIQIRWFLISIFGMILLAFAFPNLGKKGGTLKPEITQKIAIAIIFFLSGYLMKIDETIKAIKHWQLHVYIQICSLGVFPLWAYICTRILTLFHFNESLIDGIIILACLPTAIATNIIATIQANGNKEVALFNSAFGNSVGVFISPAVAYIFFSGSNIFSHISFGELLFNIFITVIVPLIVGQAFYRLYLQILKSENRILAKFGNPFSSILILYLVYCSFCDFFSGKLSVSSVTIFGIVLIDVMLYLTMVGFVFASTIPKFWHFSRGDRVAAMFTGPQKTFPLGIALINGIFASDPNIGLVSLPLILFQPIQIIVGGILATKLKEWTDKESIYGAIPLDPL